MLLDSHGVGAQGPTPTNQYASYPNFLGLVSLIAKERVTVLLREIWHLLMLLHHFTSLLAVI